VKESWRRPPGLSKLLSQAVAGKSKPTAFVLAGHNGSGKTTLWNERLAPQLLFVGLSASQLSVLRVETRKEQGVTACRSIN
jgi:hypothetical protein